MKEVTVITDTLSSVSQEMAEEHDIIVVPYHLIFDGKDYLDNTFDKEKLYARLKSYQNLPTHSACTTGEILKAYKQASTTTKNMVFIALSSTMSADYNAALQAKDIAKKELPDINIEVVDSHTVISGELLVVLAAAKAADEGKNLSETAEIARQVVQKLTFINLPETLFFFQRSGRGGGNSNLAKSPIPIHALMAMDTSSGGTGQVIAKYRSKARAIDGLLEIVKAKSKGKKLHAVISYTDNPEDAEELKKKLLSRFEVSELYITEWPLVGAVVGGPGCISLGFYSED